MKNNPDFFDNVNKTKTCWFWTGRKTPNGYGVFKGKVAHRYLYQELNGPLPKHLLACHHCDNPPCVNPKHIFIGTPSDNIRDCHNKGRNGWNTKPHKKCKRGHDLTNRTKAIQYNGRCKICYNNERREKYKKDPTYRAKILSRMERNYYENATVEEIAKGSK